jgi:hypothetical protein
MHDKSFELSISVAWGNDFSYTIASNPTKTIKCKMDFGSQKKRNAGRQQQAKKKKKKI